MKKIIIFYAFALFFTACSLQEVTVDIVISKNAGEIEKLAAEELQAHLLKIYPDYSFTITNQEPGNKKSIRIGIAEQLNLSQTILDSVPDNLEGYLVTIENKNSVMVISKGEQGLLFGVYNLLEKLGCRFMLDTEYIPERKEQLDFSEWELKNEPLVSLRYANPWEVYLEGCSSWDLDKWEQYIRNVQRMGYNSILVHAYGNDPMFTFDFNGKTKPIGHLTSSIKGRGWGQKHVNDVRRMPGGNSVFEKSAFGSERALVPDDERAKQSQDFMAKVFNNATQRGLKVNFALDFDISSNIPQNIVTTLPESDRFMVTTKGIGWMGEKAGTYWIPNVDTHEGYNYYKAQLKQVLKLYPGISTYTLWRRRQATLYCDIKYEELPNKWKTEYDQFTKDNPGTAELPQAVGTFATRKLVVAYKNILEELGSGNIKLAIGTWHLHNDLKVFETIDRFIPQDVNIIILDSEITRSEFNLKNKEWINHLSTIMKKDRYVPIIWAHHDDGEYIGSPFEEFGNFYDLMTTLNTAGFGVIHWINRPLDLFFINHNRQVWEQTRNETAESTCRFLADGIWFNDSEMAAEMGKYLLKFWHEFPPMSRANTAHIFHKPISKYGNPDSIQIKTDQRITFLNTVNTNQFSDEQNEFINFFKNYELFLKMLVDNQLMYEKLQVLVEQEKWDEAKTIASECYPEKTMEQLAKVADDSFVTNGDMGFLFSLGVRWLPHFISAKQCLGLEPVRINFEQTLHEPLAQMPGKDTYFIDKNSDYWKVLGEEETKNKVVLNTNKSTKYTEIYEYGLAIGSTLEIPIKTISGNEKIVAGEYTLKLLLATVEGIGSLKVIIDDSVHNLTIDKPEIKSINMVLDGKSNPMIRVTSEGGSPLLCGFILDEKVIK